MKSEFLITKGSFSKRCGVGVYVMVNETYGFEGSFTVEVVF